jgi:hypothetical protein
VIGEATHTRVICADAPRSAIRFSTRAVDEHRRLTRCRIQRALDPFKWLDAQGLRQRQPRWKLGSHAVISRQADYHGAIDSWLESHNKKTIFCLFQFRNVALDALRRVYLATPREGAAACRGVACHHSLRECRTDRFRGVATVRKGSEAGS